MPGFFPKQSGFKTSTFFLKWLNNLLEYDQRCHFDVSSGLRMFQYWGRWATKITYVLFFLQKEHGSQNSPYNVCSSYLQGYYRGVLQMCNKIPKPQISFRQLKGSRRLMFITPKHRDSRTFYDLRNRNIISQSMIGLSYRCPIEGFTNINFIQGVKWQRKIDVYHILKRVATSLTQATIDLIKSALWSHIYNIWAMLQNISCIYDFQIFLHIFLC